MFDSNKNKKLGERIKYAIKNKGITQRMLAEKIGKYESEISKWCKGDGTPPYEILVKIVEVTNCNPGWLLTGEGEMNAWEGREKKVSEENDNLTEVQLYIKMVHANLDLILDEGEDKMQDKILGDIKRFSEKLKSKKRWSLKTTIGE